MKKNLIVLLTATLVFGTVSFASAIVYSYDFGTMGYSQGQNLEGFTLDSATFTSEDGNLQYTNNYGAGLYNGNGGDADIYINFSESVDWLSFTAGDGAGDLDAFAISLYQFGTGSFLGTWNSPQFGGTNEPEWYTLDISFANIGSVIFDQGNGGALPGELGLYGGVILTDFSYNTAETAPVPEPGTLLLLGSGLAGLAFYRRKKMK